MQRKYWGAVSSQLDIYSLPCEVQGSHIFSVSLLNRGGRPRTSQLLWIASDSSEAKMETKENS